MIVPGKIIKNSQTEFFFGTKYNVFDQNSQHHKFLKQAHSNKVVLLTDPLQETSTLEVDAIVTKLNNINLCIKTADCVPILIHDIDNDIIAGIHAGWRGACSGIIQNTIKLIESIGGNTATMYVFIGPCIRQNSYEVNDEVFNALKNVEKNSNNFFKKYKIDKFLFDLPGYCKYVLCDLGINQDNITDSFLDTFPYPNLFYSYRYCQKNDIALNATQRQISMIKLIKV